ncbi:hypothetical protein JOF56_011405 [Kibdelosporangium banguiense]|uniref:Lipoprotein n=1 Tax=Kibdelosporangium banguiense TaxID=1365924 RepID=A0ABS4U2X7_9PSEU|nr:LppA family lipoprotein [Kibdelosporangium banguiense]MBP2331020.1 hypothetical protein [Kibdelosporangium banguiense]
MRPLAPLFMVLTVLVIGCGPTGKQGKEEEKKAMENSQFAELMTRPDIDSAVKRYEELRAKIRSRLVDAKFLASWQERPDSSGGGGCSRDFPEVTSDDARFLALPTWRSDGNLPDGKWDAAVAAVTEIARQYGFGDPKTVVNRPSDHEVSTRDGYGAELLFGTAKNTILTLTTGCHLTAAAHQRGTPTAKPTY